MNQKIQEIQIAVKIQVINNFMLNFNGLLF